MSRIKRARNFAEIAKKFYTRDKPFSQKKRERIS